jgi:hypothetical protein
MGRPQWVHGELVEVIGDGTIRIASSSRSQTWYTVTLDGCGCQGWQMRRLCRHHRLFLEHPEWALDVSAAATDADALPVRIATSRYQNRNLAGNEFAPIGITVGRPKFKLPYVLAGYVGLLAPYGLMHVVDDVEFERRYRARLERFGVPMIRRRLEALAKGRTAVLLCYEDVHRGELCHRRSFADWWTEQAGEDVDELP